MNISIRTLERNDLKSIFDAFAKAQWSKPASTFQHYLDEQSREERIAWVAHVDEHFAGYITLKWQSQYAPFKANAIPEIMDLNVLPQYQQLGIGSKLLKKAEITAATKSDVVGIGVGLYDDYGSAQILYVKRGYIPDGKGVTYNYKPIQPGSTTRLDDNFVLWFMKKLT